MENDKITVFIYPITRTVREFVYCEEDRAPIETTPGTIVTLTRAEKWIIDDGNMAGIMSQRRLEELYDSGKDIYGE